MISFAKIDSDDFKKFIKLTRNPPRYVLAEINNLLTFEKVKMFHFSFY